MFFLKFQLSTIDIKENNWILDIDLVSCNFGIFAYSFVLMQYIVTIIMI